MILAACFNDAYQFGYVTDELEKAAAYLRGKLGIRDLFVREVEMDVEIAGNSRSLKMRVGFANVGDRQIEVIQPISGAIDHYVDGVDFGRAPLTFHHLGIAIEGPVAAWHEMEQAVRASGDDFAVSYAGAAPQFEVRYAYVDTRAGLGHFTEYLWWSCGVRAANAHIPQVIAG